MPWRLRQPRHSPRASIPSPYPDFWPEAGRLSILIDDIELAGDGELLRRREDLIRRLGAEGLCDPRRFPPLPRFPRGVGVVAGHGSDALRDVVQGLGDRFPGAAAVIACCAVQGAGAPQAVVAALARLDLHPLVDVIVVARGGGSVRDLAAFDDEALCRALRAVSKPVVTAIGHTDNDPVCNHVTHAAYVPRHAAERVVPDRRELLRDLDESQATMDRGVAALRRRGEEVDARCVALRASQRVRAARGELAEHGEVLDDATHAFLAEGRAMLADARDVLTRGPARVRAAVAARLRAVEDFAAAAVLARREPARARAEVERLGETLARAGRRVLVGHRDNYRRALDRQVVSQKQAVTRQLGLARERLDRDGHGLRQAGRRVLGGHQDDYGRALDRHGKNRGKAAKRRLRGGRERLDRDGEQLTESGTRARRELRRRVETQVAVLRAGDYRRRGWLLATDAAGRAVTGVRGLRHGQHLRLHLEDGEVDALAERLRPFESDDHPLIGGRP